MQKWEGAESWPKNSSFPVVKIFPQIGAVGRYCPGGTGGVVGVNPEVLPLSPTGSACFNHKFVTRPEEVLDSNLSLTFNQKCLMQS